MSLQISRFNPKQIEERRVNGAGPATCVFIGKRGTGKSTLVADILYHCKKIPMGVAISATEDGNAFYSSHIPDIFIHSEYKPDVIQQIITRQKKAISKNPGKKDPTNDAFVLLDDCMYDKRMIKDPNIRGIFMNGRHFKVLFIITMQYALGIPPNLRTNIDYVFILREPYIANRKRIYENYAGMFTTFESFCQVMDQCTENYECLVINNNAKSNKLHDQIFWYKAEHHKNFKLGSKEFWDISKEMGSDDEGEQYDPSKSKKRNAVSINVKKSTKW